MQSLKQIFLYIFILLSFESFSQITDTVDLNKIFGKFVGGFCIYDINTSKYIQYNKAQCEKRFSPCSTFKIPNSLIGLETGVITDTSFVIKYDSLLHPKDSFMLNNSPYKYWYDDLSLKNAFKYSCVWYYQELARRIGFERMKKYIDILNYGNKDISGGIDKFWLCGTIEISINEQVEFLKAFYQHKLKGFSDRSIDAVKSIMLYETTDNYKLYGKTGSGDCTDDKVLGWYVGFVETASGPKIFAMNVLVNYYNDLNNNYRIELTKTILKELKII